jgi:hypothetical protein
MITGDSDVIVTENGEAGSFLTIGPFYSLTGSVLEETEAGLHEISRRLTKLFRFVGGAIGERYDTDPEVDGEADKKSEGRAEKVQNGRDWDRDRKWQLGKLRYINVELYHQIGAMLEIKLEVLDAIERLKMANLEQSIKDELRAQLKIATRGKQSTAVGQRPNGRTAIKHKRRTPVEQSSNDLDGEWVTE